jgi:predicted Zn-dependent peptidase
MDNKFIFNKLDNNIKVLLIPIKNIKLVHLQLAFNIGSDIEKLNEGTLEVSHFMEHMYSYLTSSKYPDALKLASKFKLLGISTDASVDSNTSKYDIKFHNKNIDFVFDVLINAYKDFKVDTKIFEQERVSIQEEIKNILDDIWNSLNEDINKELYKNHVRSLSQKHNLNNVAKLKPKDLYNFYKTYYTPNKTNLILSGDFNVKQITNKINATFGKIKPLKCNIISPGLNSRGIDNNIIFSRNTNTHSYNLFIIFKIPYYYFDKEYYENYALSMIMAKDLESILYKILRGKHGLIYSIDYEVNLDEQHTSLSNISINTQIEGKNLLKTIEIILKTLYQLKQKPISKEIYKKYLVDIDIAKLEDKICRDPEEFINLYGRNVIWDKKIETSKSMFKSLETITPEKLKKCCCSIYKKENMIIAYSGNSNYNSKIKNIISNAKI